MIELVVGNTKPNITIVLQRGGEPFPLSLNHIVTLKFRKPVSGTIVSIVLTKADLPNAVCVGNFGIGDLSEPGDILGEVVVDDGSGGVQNAKDAVRIVVRPEYGEVLR